MCDLILVRGLPGSGKSTIAKGLNLDFHFEADQFFMVDGVYKFDANRLHLAHQWCQDQTREKLAMGGRVAVSNTFTTIRELRPYFDIARERGITPNVILAQNSFNNVHNVPQEALDRMRARFQYDISSLFQ